MFTANELRSLSAEQCQVALQLIELKKVEGFTPEQILTLAKYQSQSGNPSGKTRKFTKLIIKTFYLFELGTPFKVNYLNN